MSQLSLISTSTFNDMPIRFYSDHSCLYVKFDDIWNVLVSDICIAQLLAYTYFDDTDDFVSMATLRHMLKAHCDFAAKFDFWIITEIGLLIC